MAATATFIESPAESYKRIFKNPFVLIFMLMIVFVTAHTIYQVRRKNKTVGQAIGDDLKLLATPTAIVAILGFVMGIGEFIITDNVNQHGFKPGKLFSIPDKSKLSSTVLTLLITSVITGILTDLCLRLLPKKETIAEKASNYYR